MTLDSRTIEMLNQVIYAVAIEIPNTVKAFFNPSIREQLKIKDESDFALGLALGNIHNDSLTNFKSIHGRFPHNEERKEMSAIILSRVPFIRDRIFDAG